MNSKIYEYVTYLVAWCKIQDGEYTPYDTSKLKEFLVEIVAQGNSTPIKTFKERFLKNEISFPVFCIDLMPDYKKQCYDECMETVSWFESTHNNV